MSQGAFGNDAIKHGEGLGGWGVGVVGRDKAGRRKKTETTYC